MEPEQKPAFLLYRWFAFGIDQVLILLVVVGVGLWIGALLGSMNIEIKESAWELMGLIFTSYLLLTKDTYLRGQTPGKKFADLRVIDYKTRGPANLRQLILRNITLMLGASLIEGIILLFYNRRIGDLLAGTIVVSD